MQYLLDTNVCIMYLNGRSESVRQRLLSFSPKGIVVYSVVKAELFYGGQRSNNSEHTLANQRQFLSQFVSLPFDDVLAEIFGRIRSRLATLGTLLGAYDLQIASLSLANNLTPFTHKTGEFNRVKGLSLEDLEVEESE